MLGKLLATSKALLLAGFVLLLAPRQGLAYPSELGCSSPMTVGSIIMGKAVQESTAGSVALAATGAEVACGGTIAAGEEFTLSLTGEPDGDSYQFIIETLASDGTGDWGILGGDCSKQRSANDALKTFTAPPSSGQTVTIRVAWASGWGQVYVTPDCVYTVMPASSESGSPGGSRSNSGSGSAVGSGSAGGIALEEYERSQELSSAGHMKIYWTIDDVTIYLALEVAATGWVGFGLGETSGMKGADIVYYEAAANRLVDAHVTTELGRPMTDECQDWTLIAAEQSGGKLVVAMSRKLVSSDPQDRTIVTHDAPLLPTPVLAAWGDSAEISYHTTAKRVGSAVRFNGPQGGSSFDSLAGVRAEEGMETADVHVPSFAIPTKTTFGGAWPVSPGTGNAE